MKRRVVFLDRDGTLNVDRGYVYRIEEWQFIDGAIEALKLFRDTGFAITVATNQSGIARGFYTERDVQRLHEFLHKELTNEGIEIAAIAYCPHGDEAHCHCRKPQIGMARQIERQLGAAIDNPNSWTIGDKISDIDFGQALGSQTALIRSVYWKESELANQPDLIVHSLVEAAIIIVSHRK